MLSRVVSGGQSGSDIAGLIAAKHCGLETGGWIPKGFVTERGRFPIFGELFGLTETPSSGYEQRTLWNVRDSDATLLVSSNWQSPGTIKTHNTCLDQHKPVLRITFQPLSPITDHIPSIVTWLQSHPISILNVAGNRESLAPGIKIWTTRLLIDAFYTFQHQQQQEEVSP